MKAYSEATWDITVQSKKTLLRALTMMDELNITLSTSLQMQRRSAANSEVVFQNSTVLSSHERLELHRVLSEGNGSSTVIQALVPRYIKVEYLLSSPLSPRILLCPLSHTCSFCR
jgi:hypothetical protein